MSWPSRPPGAIPQMQVSREGLLSRPLGNNLRPRGRPTRPAPARATSPLPHQLPVPVSGAESEGAPCLLPDVATWQRGGGPPGGTEYTPSSEPEQCPERLGCFSEDPDTFTEDFTGLTQTSDLTRGGPRSSLSLSAGTRGASASGRERRPVQAPSTPSHPTCTRWGRRRDLRRTPGGAVSLGSRAWPSGRTRRGESSSQRHRWETLPSSLTSHSGPRTPDLLHHRGEAEPESK